MIQINVTSNPKAVSQKETLRMANLLMTALNSMTGISGFVPNKTGMAQAATATKEAELAFRRNLKKEMQGILSFLKQSTPRVTGKTRAGWQLYAVDMPKGTEYTIMHDNKKLVDWLNYGTKPHPINPKNANVLRFKIGNKVIFAKHVDHPGTHALGFVDKARNMMKLVMAKVATK